MTLTFSALGLTAGVQVGRSPGEEWGTERRCGGHLHAHGSPGHVHHVGLCTDRRSAQPYLWRLRFQGALRPNRPR